MKIANRVFVALGFALLTASSATTAFAQSIDELTTLLSSRVVAVRGGAVIQLAGRPIASIPAATRTMLIQLFEAEATKANVAFDSIAGENDESWGEYTANLSDLVLQFNDPRALRGMAYLGIQTSRNAQDFVAGLRAQAIPVLDEAWANNPMGRGAIVETWGALLAPSNGLDSASRASVMNRLLAPIDTFPISLTFAATHGQLIALVPLFDSLAKTTPDPSLADAFRFARRGLQPQFVAQPLSSRLADLGQWLAGVCTQPPVARVGYCTAAKTTLTTAESLVQSTVYAGARGALTRLVNLTAENRRAGILSSLQATMIVADANRISASLPR